MFFVKDNQVMVREHKSLRVIHANVLGLFRYYSKQSPSDFTLGMYLKLKN